MSSLKTLLEAEFEKLKEEIIVRYRETHTGATGHWAGTLAIDTTATTAKITANSYINGRGPGKAPPSEAIEKWLVAKGIAAQTERQITTSALAFLIARKIARMGWKPHNGSENFWEDIATADRILQIAELAGNSLLPECIANISAFLKEINT